ncbi:MAG: hypothetical protein E7542_05300 [Ruminococcaceae bacterium]|nr:hypothetical protein [Oscillospiraceae bacterium]
MKYLPQSETIFNFSIILLAVMLVVLALFTYFLLKRLRKLREYVKSEKVDLAATIISIIVLAMCIGGVIVYLFCMNSMVL